MRGWARFARVDSATDKIPSLPKHGKIVRRIWRQKLDSQIDGPTPAALPDDDVKCRIFPSLTTHVLLREVATTRVQIIVGQLYHCHTVKQFHVFLLSHTPFRTHTYLHILPHLHASTPSHHHTFKQFMFALPHPHFHFHTSTSTTITHFSSIPRPAHFHTFTLPHLACTWTGFI